MCGADRRWSHGETVSGWRCPHRPGNGFGTATGTSPPRSVRGAVSRSAHRGGPEICRPAGACLRFGSQPTAHAVGHRLPVLRTWGHGSREIFPRDAKMGLVVQIAHTSEALSTRPWINPMQHQRKDLGIQRKISIRTGSGARLPRRRTADQTQASTRTLTASPSAFSD
jgi:hypothetical protein